MHRRSLYMLVAVCLVFVVGSISASNIDLGGSDPAPGEGSTSGQCFHNVQVDAPPVSGNGHGNDLKVVHVYVSGDFSDCTGSWMRVTAELNPTKSAYAVRQIPANTTQLEFTFDGGSGDFYSDIPAALNGGLIPQGTRENPPKKLDIAAISVVVAKTWE